MEGLTVRLEKEAGSVTNRFTLPPLIWMEAVAPSREAAAGDS